MLFGALLRAAARLDAGMELTDLEARLLAPLGHMFSEEELREVGRVFTEESSVRHAPQVFPQTLVARPLAEGYSTADLVKDLPQMEDVSAQPNINVVDIGAGEGEENLGGEEFGRAVEAAGYGITLVTSSAPAGQQPSGALHARILMDKFHCVDATNGEPGRDEIYWAMSSGADGGDKHAQRTGEYGATSTGDWHTFRAHERTLFDGAVTTSVGCHIACWEADDSTSGFYSEMDRKLRIISEELWQFAAFIEPFPPGQFESTAEWIKLGALIAGLIADLIAWLRNDDDFIQEHTLVFDRTALTLLATQPDKTRTLDFVGDGGIFRLYLKWGGATPGHTINIFSGGKGVWTPPVQAWPGSATPSAPALAMHDAKMYCAVRGFNDRIFISRRDNASWTRFTEVSWGQATGYAPALCSFDGKLYLAHTGKDGYAYVSASTGGTTWSQPVRVAAAGTTGPALTVRSNALHYAFSRGSQMLITFSGDGTAWHPPAAVTGLGALATGHAPALATLDNKLYLAYRDSGGRVGVTMNDATRWNTPAYLRGRTLDAPALAVRGNQMLCAIRGYDNNIYYAHFDGTSWTDYYQAPTVVSLSGPAITAPNPDDLYFAYRSATL
ncbi:hypothetical protein M1P56_17440 [Streptomyces sp. HU2014]|uniref:hypothetical protein n=1 Tax=Streptomyces sp. HU2014 TaxID=2939414 RepID=UPI00200E36F4|nr:hypothetical protein [Streptomyces sp. HU2014]UQI46006.1 hypothetical protein M1P56_17440 [Streptomyces sp. HU2014]